MAGGVEAIKKKHFSLSGWLDMAASKSRYALPAIAFLAGLLLSRAFAPVNAFFTIFIAFPIMIGLIDRAKTKSEAFSFGWWAGFGLFSLGLTWVGHSFTQQDAVPVIIAPFATMALAATMSLYVGLAFTLAHTLWPNNGDGSKGWSRIVVFASSWMFLEILRSILFTGFPWHLVGAIWADWLPVLQSVAFVSIFGLGFGTIIIGALPILFMDKTSRREANSVLALGVVAALMVVGFGQQRLASNETRFHIGTDMRLVQANVQQREKWVSYLIDDHFDNHMTLSRAGSVKGRAEGVKLLIWPEASVQRETFDREGSILRWRMSKLLEMGAFAIVGSPRYHQTTEGVRFYNSLFAINRKADLYARYDKVHLVPFGEYLPFESFFNALGLRSLTGGVSFGSGPGAETIALPGVPPFSPLICYEIIFPGNVTAPGNRPEWLLNITNDGWFGMTEGPYQHLALSRIRAVEEGLPLVRSAGTGVSAVIDPYGRTVSQLGLGKRGVVESPLPMALEMPLVSSRLRIYGVLALILVLLGVSTYGRLSKDKDNIK